MRTKVMAIIFILLAAITFPLTALSAGYGAALCQTTGYSCLKVVKGATWASLFPDEQERNLVMRINRMNVNVRPGMIIAVPNDPNQNYLYYAPFPAQIDPPGKRTVIVDPATYAWGAFEPDGKLVNWGPMSGGRAWCNDIGSACRTTVGKFMVYREGSEACRSNKFPLPDGGAPMPYCMFFKGGYAIHASNDVPGYHASHGCVRVFYEDAAWLNQQFVEAGTAVIILPYHNPTMIKEI